MPAGRSSARSPSPGDQVGRLRTLAGTWLAEADLAAGELPAGRERFDMLGLRRPSSATRAEGAAGQGLGRIACREGRVPAGLRLLEEARRRAASFPDAYVWVEAYALAELASAAVEAGHRRAREW